MKAYAQEFDGVTLNELKVSAEQIDLAVKNVDPAVIKALEKAAANIRSFHQLERQKIF